MEISFDPDNPNAEYFASNDFWHIDGALDAIPAKASILNAYVITEKGGETEFASTYAAYDDLSDEEKKRYASLRVIHTFEAIQRLSYPNPTPKQRKEWDSRADREHPLVWTHRSGRHSLVFGVADRSKVDAGLKEVRARLGQPTILVNNAGVSSPSPFLEITVEMRNDVLAVNLTGTFHCCQAILPFMLEAGWGRIVNISSSSVHSGTRGLASYVSAKSGVVGLTKCLALEFAPHGITVNTIPPGFIDTPMLRQTTQSGFISLEQQIANTPVRRIGQPEDVAAACAFLVSEEASYTTGQIIGVNGGRNT